MQRGLIGGSEHDQLQFVAAAERAMRLAREQGDACRLFAWIVNRGRWLFITCADEDAANRRLKVHLYGDPSEGRERPAVPAEVWE